MAATDRKQGSAGIQGELWGAGAQEWVDYQEPRHQPLFEHGIKHMGIGPGSTVLDVGCGTGGFCLLAAGARARVTAIDTAAPSIEIARRRVSGGRFDVGDLQFPPYEDRSFDVVAGFNSFQYAADPAAALAEARRVAKPGALVYVLVGGREERTELVALLRALLPQVPPAPAGSPGPFALSHPRALEALMEHAGLTPKEDGYIEVPFEFPDLSTWLRGTRASGRAVLAERTSSPEALEAALTEAVAPYHAASGSYRIETEWRYVIARV